MRKEWRYHEDPSILHVGCEEPHAYFVPYSQAENATVHKTNERRYTV